MLLLQLNRRVNLQDLIVYEDLICMLLSFPLCVQDQTLCVCVCAAFQWKLLNRQIVLNDLTDSTFLYNSLFLASY
jgi:hypothetical protein